MSKAIRVGILEDDEDMREYLVDVLEGEPSVEIAFSCGLLNEAARAVTKNLPPDLCLVDLDLPDGKGSDFVASLVQNSSAKALILTVLGDRESVMAGFSAGAHGYLLKDTEADQIIRHIHDTAAGANPISAQVSTHLLDHYLRHQSAHPAGKTIQTDDATEVSLTKREVEVLTLFAKGLSYKETAQAMEISPHTVNDYVKIIYGKLAVSSRNEAVFEALQLGWIKL